MNSELLIWRKISFVLSIQALTDTERAIKVDHVAIVNLSTCYRGQWFGSRAGSLPSAWYAINVLLHSSVNRCYLNYTRVLDQWLGKLSKNVVYKRIDNRTRREGIRWKWTAQQALRKGYAILEEWWNRHNEKIYWKPA